MGNRQETKAAKGYVLEPEAVTALVTVHQAQVISYLKACGQILGLLLNFREATMRRGIKRVVWSGSYSSQREKKADHVNEPHEAYGGLVVSRGDTLGVLVLLGG